MTNSLSQWSKVNRSRISTVDQSCSDPPVVVVVEDEFWIRMMIADELRAAGYRVVECSTADEAIDLLRGGLAAAIVFTDIRMPGSMDGMVLARAVRQEFPELKILMTSAQAPDQLLLSDPFIPKPYESHRVIDLIGELIGAPASPLSGGI